MGKRATEFARSYHSVGRVEWMGGKPCVACGALPCDVSHTRAGGTGRKADYQHTVPMCRTHHDEYHRQGAKTFADKYRLTLEVLAAMYEAAWQTHQARTAGFLPTGMIPPTESR